MIARGGLVVLAALTLALACSGRRQRPPGPPPEYERPPVTPWDSGAPPDPFGDLPGEEVTDDEPAVDSGALAPDSAADAALADADRG